MRETMVLYELSLPEEDRQNISELYYRATPRDAVQQTAEGLRIRAGTTVCFDAYFNILSHIAYRRHTALQAVDVRIHIQGDVRLRVCFAGPQNEDMILVEETLRCPELQLQICSFSLLDHMTEGFYYLELTAISDLLLTEGAFCVSDQCRTQESRLAIVICTYRREAYLRRNVERVLQYFSVPKRQSFWERIDLLVVDNGQTIDPDSFDNSHITILPNKNSGGSGGFSRGMREVHERGKYTHFCLMDDDIVLDPGILMRTLSFLDLCAKDFPELSIGGAMLSLETPWEQYEMGGCFTGYKCISQKTGLDLRRRDSLLINEHPEHPDYNAWWYMCMPCLYIEKYGLPFPFFVKGDDIDYGLRTGSNILVMNGIGVWHEDFKGKDFGMSEYYVKRNELILCALHCKHPSLLRNYKKLVFAVGKQLLMRRYAVVNLLLRAYEDFLAGPDAFLAIDQATLHRELQGTMPQLIPCEAVSGEPPPHRVEITRCSLADFRYRGDIFQYSQRTQLGFFCVLDCRVLAGAAMHLWKILFNMLKNFQGACYSFQNACNQTKATRNL